MKVLKTNDLRGTERDVKFNAGNSIRLLLESDNMGFSFHITEMPASNGKKFMWHYNKHLESCYCLSGRGVITDLSSGESFLIEPGTIYVLDNHDKHTFEPIEDTVLISVFNPPVKGNETHKQDGSYD